MENSGLNGIDDGILRQIVRIITGHKKVEKIVIFGSRAENTHTRTSDIDVAVFAKGWNGTDINLVKDKLENDIKTPFKFDLANYYSLSKESLKNNIVLKGKIIYESGKN